MMGSLPDGYTALVVGALFIAAAMTHTGLDRRIALVTLNRPERMNSMALAGRSMSRTIPARRN